jgi:hypothetical protein
MTQLMLAKICDDTPNEFGGEPCRSMHRALHAIAASTLLEFNNALTWGQWCRVTAAAGLRQSPLSRKNVEREGSPA